MLDQCQITTYKNSNTDENGYKWRYYSIKDQDIQIRITAEVDDTHNILADIGEAAYESDGDDTGTGITTIKWTYQKPVINYNKQNCKGFFGAYSNDACLLPGVAILILTNLGDSKIKRTCVYYSGPDDMNSRLEAVGGGLQWREKLKNNGEFKCINISTRANSGGPLTYLLCDVVTSDGYTANYLYTGYGQRWDVYKFKTGQRYRMKDIETNRQENVVYRAPFFIKE